MLIRVYSGGGSSALESPILIEEFQKHLDGDVAPIEEREMTESSAWENETSLIVFSGKSVTGFKKALGLKTLQRLHNAVAEGRMDYAGICAGGSLALAEIYYELQDSPESKPYWISNTGLSFANAVARGPVKAITPRPYQNGESDELHAIELRRPQTGEIYNGFYWGGPAFIPLEKKFGRDFETAAVLYRTPLPMTLHGTHGAGRVTLCAHHPEMNSGNIHRWTQIDERTDKGRLEKARIDALAVKADGKAFAYFLEDAGLTTSLRAQKKAELIKAQKTADLSAALHMYL